MLLPVIWVRTKQNKKQNISEPGQDRPGLKINKEAAKWLPLFIFFYSAFLL